MDERLKRAQELVERPSESLNVELKRWIDPDALEGQAKIVQAILALRNQNGGHLVIGIDNDSLKPDKANVPTNVKTKFHTDKIQGLVSKYASELFSIDVDFPEMDGQVYPVITVPSGIKTPVASKSDLIIDRKSKVAVNDVYIRTLNSNNIVSSAKVPWKDWSRIMEICFDNREADIGRFIRRHLGNLNPEMMHSILTALQMAVPEVKPTMRERIEKYRQESEARFVQVMAEFSQQLPPHGVAEVSLILDGTVPQHSLDRRFLDLMIASNPHYTGWTPWLVQHSSQERHFPRPFSGAWENLIIRYYNNSIPEFMRLGANGCFYHLRGHQEDFMFSPSESISKRNIDIDLLIMRTTEAIAVGLSLAQSMGCPPEATRLCYLFRWTDLRGRHLVRNLDRLGEIQLGGMSAESQVTSFVEVPQETPLSALGEYVHRAVHDLCLFFGGYQLTLGFVENIVQKTLTR